LFLRCDYGRLRYQRDTRSPLQEHDMDVGTEEALKAIITGIAAAEAEGGSVVEAISSSLALSSSLSAEAGDPVTAGELARLARWATSGNR
jgi:hypothetical protein